ncbi:hypothetical protein Ddc_16707 [Ditylenchus destructor]|nr:hypothetical protein Ddc_16707 [Ditylenchus destructor]
MNKIFLAVILAMLIVPADFSPKMGKFGRGKNYSPPETRPQAASIKLRAVAALENFFPIRCRIYRNQFDMDLEDFNLEFFFSKVKQYRGFYREEICFKDTKKRTLKIHNHDEAAMATILLHSVKNQNTLKFIRC